jgi:hypothetical protein
VADHSSGHFYWRQSVSQFLVLTFYVIFGLVVDLAAGQLVDTASLARIGPATVHEGQLSSLLATVQATPPRYRQLLSEFPEVVSSSGAATTPKHGVEHVIETTGRPVTAKFRRLDPDKLQAAKKEFLKMEKEGIIRRSSSCWASPLHMVMTADGCGGHAGTTGSSTWPPHLTNIQSLTCKTCRPDSMPAKCLASWI